MKNIAEILDGVKTMGIGGHVRPDGDCVGSCMALYLYVKTYWPEIQVDVYLDHPKPVFGHIVCMDEVVTECVCQALVDYNQVGNVKVIGYYYSNVTLDAIDKGIISSAIALDMEEIGRYSVNALDEYISFGHSNNYYSVDQHVITKDNTREYRTEDEK